MFSRLWLLLTLGLLLLLLTAGPAAAQNVDYDTDDDGLIDINSAAKLIAIRYDLDGDGTVSAGDVANYGNGFPTPLSTQCDDGNTGTVETCSGYELTQNITLTAAWTPPGRYTATFDGNGHTISGLSVTIGSGNGGLFGQVGSGGIIRNVGILSPTIRKTGADTSGAGGLAGYLLSGSQVNASYVSGGTVTLAAGSARVGGLVGRNNGTIRASYSTAAVSTDGSQNSVHLGGLTGFHTGAIIASYNAGTVTATGTGNHVGGLAGRVSSATSTITNSYCNSSLTGGTNCVGSRVSGVNVANTTVNGQTTAQLQSPTDYLGIYAHWNIDVDADTFLDFPWNFGSSSQYPTLRTPTQRATSPTTQAVGDYDWDDDGLIEVRNQAQLAAIASDLNGDGDASAAAYGTAFPSRLNTASNRMGCPSGTCTGYELAGDLTLTGNWTPIGEYSGVIDGNGHTISGLTVNLAASVNTNAALIEALINNAVARNLGLVSPSITSATANAQNHGALTGWLAAGASISAVYVSGGTVTTTANSSNAGGLVGRVRGAVRASWSSAAVAVSGNPTGLDLGGLVGHLDGGSITASYAYGTVSGGSGTGLNDGLLVGLSANRGSNTSSIVNSYCSAASGDCIGSQTGATVSSTRYIAADMQAPTDYAGIYALWNIDLDADGNVDFPWNFGTASQYPTLRTPTQRAGSPTDLAAGDYDADNDGLIEIRSLAQLEALGHDLNGNGLQDSVSNSDWGNYTDAYPDAIAAQCPSSACTGYELMTDITFPGGAYFWTPHGTYAATLEGNGRTLTDLSVVTTAATNTGLFRSLGATAAVRNLGLVSPSVVSQSSSAYSHGVLAGFAAAGASINAVYADGGTISAIAPNANVGGLIGLSQGAIRASWSTAAVAAALNPNGVDIGGLVGHLQGGSITASFAAGTVGEGTGTGVNHGGLAGRATDYTTPNPDVSPIVTNSYCDSTVESSGSGITGIDCHATTALQTPTDYTGIYLNWNIDLGTDGDLDYPWDFGANNEYPTLNTPAEREEAAPAATDYDADDDGLIEISTPAQLNAVRWDMDGNGAVAAANYSAYGTAFGGRQHTADSTAERMGCPLTTPTMGCVGYELTANLTLTGNWTPLGGGLAHYIATFDGNGHTISGLTISTTAGATGLFHTLGTTRVIRNVGLIAPSVTGTASNVSIGALVGFMSAGSIVETSYVEGGTVTLGGASARLGGLAGASQGTIRASYSTATLQSTSPCTGCDNTLAGGLVGRLNGGHITASYAAGANSVTAGTGSELGGLVGRAQGAGVMITDSYCDSTVMVVAGCVGGRAGGVSVSDTTAAAHSTADLQTPTAYAGLYANWNIDLDGVSGGDNPWDFGTNSDYPAVRAPDNRAIVQPPPTPVQPGNGNGNGGNGNGGGGNGGNGGGSSPQAAARGGGQPYNPAHAHPEIYANPRHEMTASCEVVTTGTGDAAITTSTLTFDLGTYTRPITLVLSLWDGQFFRTLQSQGIPMPELRQEGQTATVEVVTDPAQTRFRLDSEYGLNLVLGYADCRTDDP